MSNNGAVNSEKINALNFRNERKVQIWMKDGVLMLGNIFCPLIFKINGRFLKYKYMFRISPKGESSINFSVFLLCLHYSIVFHGSQIVNWLENDSLTLDPI